MKPVLLCILDGVGIREEEHGNALKMAKTPTFDLLWNSYPHCLLDASEESVGLPSGQMGNSEVGHSNIGAGRIIYQPQQLINEEIKNKKFFQNKNILEVIEHTKKNKSKLHILGLLSDGGIHSHIDHLMNLIDMVKNNGIEQIYFHVFLDGRDTAPNVALTYLNKLEEKIKEVNMGVISTISGRYYAMDRDNRWERVKKAYDAIVYGEGINNSNYEEEIKKSYEKEVYDEFIEPIVVNKEGLINDNDGLIVFNYRPDRLRELFYSLTNKEFKEFNNKKLKNIKLVTMFPVSNDVVCKNAYQKQELENTLGTYLSNQGLTQLRIAETEKYAHVTYFFDGGKELELKGKKQILIPSPKVDTYDLKPEMSAYEITDKLLEEIDNDTYDFIVLNFANGDMVGHTGNLKATIQALEDLDKCLGRIFDKIKEKKGTLIVTADHGNSDYMLDENDNPVTTHSMSKVPFIIAKSKYKLHDGKLADIAPTILKLMNLKIPKEMTGESLIDEPKKKKNYLFIILSLIFLILVFGNYIYRFIHYYNLENNPDVVVDNRLSTKLKENIVTSGDGLYFNNSEYIFKGKNVNNYLYYSGYMFRIVKINEDGTIKLITDNSITNLAYNLENTYKTSYIRNYLNDNELEHTGIFYKTLNNASNNLMATSYCIDKISLDKVTCKETVNDYVGLLSYQEYIDANAYDSYLNNNTYWWLSNASDDDIWYVFNDGGVNDIGISENHLYGVRPVINLKADIEVFNGNGSIDNPYKIENDSLSVGKYINYSNYIWKIIDIQDDRIKLALNDYVTIDNKENYAFSNKDNIFNPSDKTSIAYYLNNNFYQTLNKDLLIKGTWYIGEYNVDNKYDYNSLYSKTIESYVGLLKVDDLFINDMDNYYLITPATADYNYALKNNTTISSLIEEELKIRPSIYIKNNLNLKGTGTLLDPYIVEE